MSDGAQISNNDPVSCIILAGGEGARAGGQDKGLISYQGKPLIEHVIASVLPQVEDIVISANRNFKSYERYSATVIGDTSNNYRGPLAGIAACLKHCRHKLVLVVACDMPTLPADLVSRLLGGIQENSISIAMVDSHHQLALIIRREMADSAQQQLDCNQLKLIQWVKSVAYKTISFDDKAAAFINLNQLSDTDQ